MSDKNEILQEGLEFVSPLISQWILPKVKDLLDSSTTKLGVKAKEIRHDYYKNQFEDYLSNRYTKFFTLETLVFPNYPTLFDKLYYPLTVERSYTQLFSGGGKKKEYIIDNIHDDFLPHFKKVLIQDDAGMGKSTILRKIFLSCIRENKGIPVLVELRKLNKSNLLLDEVKNQFSTLRKDADKELLLKLIERGDFVFLFDGLDEIPFDNREDVLNDLLKFIEKSGNNLFLISSRPESFVSSFKDFEKCTIKLLERHEAYQLFQNYDYYNFKKVADDLISILSTSQLENVSEFLKNPFLASLVYKTFSYRKDIPSQKEQFYRKVYDALYEEHDLSKEGYFPREKYSNLGIDDFERVLRGIGYKTMRLGKVEYSKNEFLEIIKVVKDFCTGLNFRESDFLKDIIHTVPLFKLEGESFKWIHKSYQDYFAARFVVCDTGSKKENIIFDLSKSDIHFNQIDFLSVMEPKLFKHIIVKNCIKDFLDVTRKLIIPGHPLSYEQNIHISFFNENILYFGVRVFSSEEYEIEQQRRRANNVSTFFEDLQERELNFERRESITAWDERGKYFIWKTLKRKRPETKLLEIIYGRYPNIFLDFENSERIKKIIDIKDKKNLWDDNDLSEFLLNDVEHDKIISYPKQNINLLDDKTVYVFNLLFQYSKFRNSVADLKNINFLFFDYNKCKAMIGEINSEIANENKAVDFF